MRMASTCQVMIGGFHSTFTDITTHLGSNIFCLMEDVKTVVKNERERGGREIKHKTRLLKSKTVGEGWRFFWSSIWWVHLLMPNSSTQWKHFKWIVSQNSNRLILNCSTSPDPLICPSLSLCCYSNDWIDHSISIWRPFSYSQTRTIQWLFRLHSLLKIAIKH